MKIFFFWLPHIACGTLVPWPGIEPISPALEALEAWSPIHWTTREVPEDTSKMLQYPIKKYFNTSSNSVAFVKNLIF